MVFLMLIIVQNRTSCFHVVCININFVQSVAEHEVSKISYCPIFELYKYGEYQRFDVSFLQFDQIKLAVYFYEVEVFVAIIPMLLLYCVFHCQLNR